MPEKIKMQLGRTDDVVPVKEKRIGKNTEKTKEFLKAQIAESTPGTVSQGNSLKVTEQGKIVEEARKDVLDSYPPEKVIVQEIPFPEEKAPATSVVKKGKKSVIEYIKDAKKKLFMTLGFITLAGASKATEKNNAEKEFTYNSHNIEYVNTDPGDKGKKVKEVPPGYVKSHTEGKKTYYKKVTGGGELKIAKPGDGKGSAEYENWLKDLLQKGEHSPEKLAEMGYISSGVIEKYRKYYTPPEEDIVYTEPDEGKKVEADPYSAYAKDGESIWGTNRHLMAILSVPVRDTKSITESGNINTSDSKHKVLIRFVHQTGPEMGKPTGECVELETGQIQDYFGTTMTMQSDDLMKDLKAKVKKNPTYVATAEDFAKTK